MNMYRLTIIEGSSFVGLIKRLFIPIQQAVITIMYVKDFTHTSGDCGRLTGTVVKPF